MKKRHNREGKKMINQVSMLLGVFIICRLLPGLQGEGPSPLVLAVSIGPSPDSSLVLWGSSISMVGWAQPPLIGNGDKCSLEQQGNSVINCDGH
jgi:hypothetical protein